jgi:hypothetical protein
MLRQGGNQRIIRLKTMAGVKEEERLTFAAYQDFNLLARDNPGLG